MTTPTTGNEPAKKSGTTTGNRRRGSLASALASAPVTKPNANDPEPGTPPQPGPEGAPVQTPPESAPDVPAAEPTGAPEGKEEAPAPQAPETAAQAATQGPQSQQEPVTETTGTDIVQAPQRPTFSMDRMFAPKPEIDEFEYNLINDRMKRISGRISNNMDILRNAIEEFQALVDRARKAGFPEQEIQIWAVKARVDIAPPQP